MNQEEYVKAKLVQRIGELEIKLYETEFEKIAFAQKIQALEQEISSLKEQSECGDTTTPIQEDEM